MVHEGIVPILTRRASCPGARGARARARGARGARLRGRVERSSRRVRFTLRSLHYSTLQYTTLQYTTLHYTTLHYTALHCITLHYTAVHYIALHCTISQSHYNCADAWNDCHGACVRCYMTSERSTFHHITSYHITSRCVALHCGIHSMSPQPAGSAASCCAAPRAGSKRTVGDATRRHTKPMMSYDITRVPRRVLRAGSKRTTRRASPRPPPTPKRAAASTRWWSRRPRHKRAATAPPTTSSSRRVGFLAVAHGRYSGDGAADDLRFAARLCCSGGVTHGRYSGEGNGRSTSVSRRGVVWQSLMSDRSE